MEDFAELESTNRWAGVETVEGRSLTTSDEAGWTDKGSLRALAERTTRTSLRTLHVLAVGAYFGGHVFSVAPERLVPALVAVVVTGALFALFEIVCAPVWIVQLRGVCTGIKLLLLAAVPLFWEQRLWILALIMTIGVVITHAPGAIRYYSVLHRRVVQTRGNG